MEESVLGLSHANELFFVCLSQSFVVYSLFEGHLTTISTGLNTKGIHAISN